MSDLENRTRYEPSEAEPRVFERWEESGLFHPEPTGSPEDNYSIAIPPPNVTGALHMGHALNGSIQDALIRHARMQGRNTKWILGTDHAGIATQTQVERALKAQGTSKEELGREEFLERMWEWRHQYGGTIISQYRRLGASVDYEDERFTLDDRYVRAVLKVFVDLYDKGLIYRDNYMVNWDPGSGSAISDLEVEEREVDDTLYYVDYQLEGCEGSVTIATVRPETMLADTAIAVHPDDDRYTRLVGETAILPLVGRRLKIIADPYVKPEFGTGALKITPGHDPNDFEIGRSHGLEEISAIGEDGRMTEAAGERFAGMTALEAREAVVDALREEGRIARTEPYRHNVPFSHRSGERIEPLISLQWFCRMEELAAPAIEVVRDGRVRIRPEGQRRRYFDWMENIRPWCISRQLWWGHRIPVWYRGEEIYCGIEPPQGDGWEQDPDVLDTWFSSQLWPFATLGWPDDTPELRAFYPTDVLLTARDIIFLWVARMIMSGLEFVGDIPFRDVYVHPIIQAPDGRRMSKSLGTGIDPLDLIEGGPRPPVFEQGGEFPAYGADAVRFGLLAMSSSQDVRFNEDKVAQGRQLANKLFNASRLVLLRVPDELPEPRAVTVEDAWILSRLQRAKAAMEKAFEDFEFHRAALGLYDFVYGDLCDWYLELIKPRLYADDNAEVSAVALHVLRETLALAHPVIPFVTEEIWSYLPGSRGPADGGPVADARRGARGRGGRGRAGPRDRRRAGAARLARPGRRGAGPRARGAARGRGLRPHGRRRRPPLPRDVDRERHGAGRHRPHPGRQRGDPGERRGRHGGGGEARRRRAHPARGGDQARAGQARQRRLHRQGPAARRPGRARQARTASVGAGCARMSWTLEQAETHLLSVELFGMKFGLERMRRVLTALGSPQQAFRSIHVVGTNGKSSTVRMAAAILEAHGIRTGAYLSPHLSSFAERIRIGDADLDPDAFGAAVERAAMAAAKVDRTLSGGERVTQFELLTAAAFSELAERGVEAAVVEAGLGGRHDATNVLAAPVAVLTNVGLEHTRWLGPTITDIAREKLAVVAPGSTLVVGELDPEAEAEVAKVDARVVHADPDDGVPFTGFQRANFSVARAATGAFLGSPLDEAAVLRAASSLTVPGRFQVVADAPLTIFDGAHNPSGVVALASALRDAVGEKPLVAVLSVLDDKDAAGMLRELVPLASGAVFTASRNPRALSPATLSSLWDQLGGPAAEIEGDPRAAVERAQALAGEEGAVVATGSIYLVADLLSEPGRRRASAL